MYSCTKIILAEDLERNVADMDYAVVRQSKRESEAINVFVKIDGTSVDRDAAEAMTISEYRKLKNGSKNAIVYDCGPDGVEVVIKYPNGYGVHAISTPRIKGGRTTLEVAVKCGRKVTFNTPVADDLIENVSLVELRIIMDHVENLLSDGMDFRKGYKPLKQYDRRGFLQEVFGWYRSGKKNLMLK